MNPLIPKDGLFRLSAHKLNLMRECPFKLVMYLMHYPATETDNTYAVAGSAVHDYLEETTKGCAQEPESYLGKWKVPATASNGDNVHDRFYKCIENGKAIATLPGAMPEQTEYTTFITPKGRKVKLETRIDVQCDNSIFEGADGKAKGKVVFDYKTGKSVDKDEYKVQARVYQFAKYMAKDGVYKACFISLLDPTKYFIIDEKHFDVNFIPALCDEYIDHLLTHNLERQPNSYLCPKYCPYYELYCKKDVCWDKVEEPETLEEKDE